MNFRRENRRDVYTADSGRGFSRSGWATAVIIAVLLIGFGMAWHLHQHARFHQLTATIIPQTSSAPMPGGQEAILLSRVALLNDAEPEFVSATVVPGIGMQLLQAVVASPDGAQQPLLASAPLSDVSHMPVAQVTPAVFHVRVGTRHLQDEESGTDLVDLAPAADALNQTLVDGGQATGRYQGQGALAGVTAAMEITLSGRAIDVTARVTSSADENRYVSFEWCPRFLITPGPSGFYVSVPSSTILQDGAVRNVSGTDYNFTAPNGSPLGARPFSVRYVGLSHDFLSDGTAVRLQNNPRFFIRLQAFGQSLRSLQLQSDPATHTLLVGVSSTDPTADPEQRDQALRPGQTLVWHVRMEVLPPGGGNASADDTR